LAHLGISFDKRYATTGDVVHRRRDLQFVPSDQVAKDFAFLLGRCTVSQIGSVILLAFDIGLHVGRGDNPHGMPERLKLARPMVRSREGLDADQAGWQLLKERDKLPTRAKGGRFTQMIFRMLFGFAEKRIRSRRAKHWPSESAQLRRCIQENRAAALRPDTSTGAHDYSAAG